MQSPPCSSPKRPLAPLTAAPPCPNKAAGHPGGSAWGSPAETGRGGGGPGTAGAVRCLGEPSAAVVAGNCSEARR